MSADTVSSIGTKFYHTALDAANEIGGILDISGPSFSRDVLDTTNHSSPEDFKESIVTRWDGNEVTFDLQWRAGNTNHQFLTNQITTSVAADDPKTYVLRFPAAKAQAQWCTITFTAHLSNFATGLPVEGVVTASVTLRVTGKPVINYNDTTTL